MTERRRASESITNLSMDLIVPALELVQQRAFPVYQRNIDSRDPPFAHGEFGPCAIAALLITSGLDYHLARLKYLRDVARSKPPLPHTPYFNWTMGVPLAGKIEQLLYKRTEKRLKEQLIELTIMRDCVAHPKLSLVRQFMNPDYSYSKQKARLSAGESHRPKTLQRKLKRSERTKSLRLPLVPAWISYVDIVTCVLVLTRFLYLLEQRYGNPYAWLGDLVVKNSPDGFFNDWESSGRRKSISIGDWAQAFFNSLAPIDQIRVEKRLGTKATRYIQMHVSSPGNIRHGNIAAILRAMQNPSPPEFLRKPPPWKKT